MAHRAFPESSRPIAEAVNVQHQAMTSQIVGNIVMIQVTAKFVSRLSRRLASDKGHLHAGRLALEVSNDTFYFAKIID